LESAKKCVTTYLPNELVLKMDGAIAFLNPIFFYYYKFKKKKKEIIISRGKV